MLFSVVWVFEEVRPFLPHFDALLRAVTSADALALQIASFF